MKHCLLGPIWGDICGVPYEFARERERNPGNINLAHPERDFSDDTVLTLAVAKAILVRRPYRDTIFEMAQAYPNRGFGGRFLEIFVRQRNPVPYNSFGNGAAMRVAPVGWAFNTVESVLREAKASAECSHNHPEGIRSAQAVALAIFLARKGHDKAEIHAALKASFGDAYDLSANLPAIREQALQAGFDETWKAVPPALGVFLQTETFEDCLRQAIALGGDTDTQACIACSVAEAYYGPDETLAPKVAAFLPPDLLNILTAFSAKYGM